MYTVSNLDGVLKVQVDMCRYGGRCGERVGILSSIGELFVECSDPSDARPPLPSLGVGSVANLWLPEPNPFFGRELLRVLGRLPSRRLRLVLLVDLVARAASSH